MHTPLDKAAFQLFEYDEIDSTNNEAKRLIGAARSVSSLYGRAVVTARRQSAGRGRNGKSFASPGGESIYASFILAPPENPAEQRLTMVAAVAVCEAIEACTSYKPGIKWVNDIIVDTKKVCGILSELIPGAVVVGIGININIKNEDFPEELNGTAGSLVMESNARKKLFEKLVETVFRLMKRRETEESAILEAYLARLIGPVCKDSFPL